MTRMQKFALFFVPQRFKDAAIEESHRWMMNCECGRSWSLWEMGGVRYKGTGNKRVLCTCPDCGVRKMRPLTLVPRGA